MQLELRSGGADIGAAVLRFSFIVSQDDGVYLIDGKDNLLLWKLVLNNLAESDLIIFALGIRTAGAKLQAMGLIYFSIFHEISNLVKNCKLQTANC